MAEFKGTKGKWVYDYEQESILSENGYIIADIFPIGQEANALLISKAPEMLDFINRISGEMLRNDFVLDEKWYEQAQQLIKEATEL